VSGRSHHGNAVFRVSNAKLTCQGDNSMGKSKPALCILTAISTLINASAAASQMTCSINEKHYCEAGSECRRIENTMSARIDLDRKLYSRCDESGCDEFQVQISQQGNSYNINLINVLAHRSHR
jgi:hypothetical protein